MGQALGLVVAAAQLGLEAILIKPKRKIGDFVAQVTLEETHTDELEITDHPVELGAHISDHAFMRPVEVVIKCGWSDSPSKSGLLAGLLGAVTGTIEGVSSLISGNDVSQSRVVYAQLLDLQKGRIPFDVQTGKRLYRNMLVKTLRVETTKESEHSLLVVATLREVILVSTRVLTVAAPASAQADPGVTGSVANQGTKQVKPADNYSTGADIRARR